MLISRRDKCVTINLQYLTCVATQPYYLSKKGGGRVAQVQSQIYEPIETHVHAIPPAPVVLQSQHRKTTCSHCRGPPTSRNKPKYKDLRYMYNGIVSLKGLIIDKNISLMRYFRSHKSPKPPRDLISRAKCAKKPPNF